MVFQFKKHYTREEARALLPDIRNWLGKMRELTHRIQKTEQRLSSLLQAGQDLGGETVNTMVREMADLKSFLLEFQKRQIFIKDVERGLLDFPAIIGGKEVFLCWEEGEDDIEFWHDIDSGYAGRERL